MSTRSNFYSGPNKALMSPHPLAKGWGIYIEPKIRKFLRILPKTSKLNRA
ncbi:MAG: hypothetical protein R2865_03610 [Deinococcales bacterium]